jgi:GGDEF domain-containing protein
MCSSDLDQADDILSFFISELNKFKRADDFVGRWGGDEILLVLDTSKSNAELKVLARLLSYRDQIAERYKNLILSKVQDNQEYRSIIEKAINTSLVNPSLLAELGIPTRLTQETVLDFKQKIESELVVLGSARYGVAEIDFSKIDFSRIQATDLLVHFDNARVEAESQAVQKKLIEAKALGTSSRPAGLK